MRLASIPKRKGPTSMLLAPGSILFYEGSIKKRTDVNAFGIDTGAKRVELEAFRYDLIAKRIGVNAFGIDPGAKRIDPGAFGYEMIRKRVESEAIGVGKKATGSDGIDDDYGVESACPGIKKVRKSGTGPVL